MNYLILISLSSILLITFLTFSACSRLPSNPKKISITLSRGGGMSQNYSRIYISKDSCKYDRSYYDQEAKEQKKEHVTYSLNTEEFAQLYKVFKKYQFLKIQVRKEENVYDRGGTSITLMIDGKNHSKANAGLSFVKKGSLKNFQAIVNAISQLNASKIKNLK